MIQLNVAIVGAYLHKPMASHDHLRGRSCGIPALPPATAELTLQTLSNKPQPLASNIMYGHLHLGIITMPEEIGIEPQELFEQAEKSHHISEHHAEESGASHFAMRSAVTASILAVGAALASLASGHAANEAIVKTVEASDQWSYYQAKSTKAQIFEGERTLLSALSTKVAPAELAGFDKKIKQYEHDKVTVQKNARGLEDASREEFARHQKFSIAVAAFQIGIVLSSVAIITRNSWLYYESLFAGICGVVFCLLGWF